MKNLARAQREATIARLRAAEERRNAASAEQVIAPATEQATALALTEAVALGVLDNSQAAARAESGDGPRATEAWEKPTAWETPVYDESTIIGWRRPDRPGHKTDNFNARTLWCQRYLI